MLAIWKMCSISLCGRPFILGCISLMSPRQRATGLDGFACTAVFFQKIPGLSTAFPMLESQRFPGPCVQHWQPCLGVFVMGGNSWTCSACAPLRSGWVISNKCDWCKRVWGLTLVGGHLLEKVWWNHIISEGIIRVSMRRSKSSSLSYPCCWWNVRPLEWDVNTECYVSCRMTLHFFFNFFFPNVSAMQWCVPMSTLGCGALSGHDHNLIFLMTPADKGQLMPIVWVDFHFQDSQAWFCLPSITKWDFYPSLIQSRDRLFI